MQTPSKTFNPPTRHWVIFIVSGLAFTGTYASIGLFADGAYGLLSILSTKDFFAITQSRQFVDLITEAPLVFAARAGVTNLNTLMWIHSFGPIFLSIAFWVLALIKQRNTDLFWLFILAFCATYLSSGFCAVAEYNLTYAMVGFCASILLKDNPLSQLEAIALIATAFLLIYSYEAMLFLGPLLVSLACFRWYNVNQEKALISRLALSISSVFLLVGAGISVLSILHPRTPHNLNDALLNIFPMLGSMNILYFILMGFLFIHSIYHPHKSTLLLAWFISIVHIANFHFWNSPGMNYGFRALSGLLEFVIFALAGLYYLIYRTNSKDRLTLIQNTKIRAVLSTFTHMVDSIHQTKSNPIPVLFFVSLVIPFYILHSAANFQ